MLMVFVTFLLTISALPVFTLYWKLNIIEKNKYVSISNAYYVVQAYYFFSFIMSMVDFTNELSAIDVVNVILSSIYFIIFIVVYYSAYYKNKETINQIVDYFKLKNSLKKQQIKLYKSVLSDMRNKLFQDNHYTIVIPKTCFSNLKSTKGLSYYSAVYRLAVAKILKSGNYTVSCKGNWHQRDAELVIMIDRKVV